MMGICNDEDFELEINSLTKIEPEIIPMPDKGRGYGNGQVPESLRKIIGEESIEGNRQSALELGRAFGISDSSVSAYSAGSTSTSSYQSPVRSLNSHLNKVKEKIQSKARRRLTLALDSITPEKLQEANLREASGVARDMSVIIKNLEPESNKEENNNTQFVIYAPSFRDERSFDIIRVNE
jgi:hypothetical protein